MNYFFKFFSSRIMFVLLFGILLVDIHRIITEKIFKLDSLDLNPLGLFDYPLDIMKLSSFTTIKNVYLIVTVVGIFFLTDLFYKVGFARLKRPVLDQRYSELDEEEAFHSQSSYGRTLAEENKRLAPFTNEENPKTISNGNFPVREEKGGNFSENRNLNGELPEHLQKIMNYKSEYLTKNEKEEKEQGNSVHATASTFSGIPSIKVSKKVGIDQYIRELEELIGLEEVKVEINSIINFIRVNQMRLSKGLPTNDISYHMVFTGNPGTGKTTVARILANIFRELNIISRGHLIEVDRSGMVAGYMGQTALKVRETIERARGGVLFIDEAYSLTNESSGNDYGNEAVETLLKLMEDYRNDLIVIAAGYSDMMGAFVNSNPGLKSRFNRFIHFEDYTPEELLTIYKLFCHKSNYVISDEAYHHLKRFFHTIYQTEREKFGNGRGVRNLFEKTLTAHANRMALYADPSPEKLSVIVSEDITIAVKEIYKNRL